MRTPPIVVSWAVLPDVVVVVDTAADVVEADLVTLVVVDNVVLMVEVEVVAPPILVLLEVEVAVDLELLAVVLPEDDMLEEVVTELWIWQLLS